MDNLRLLIVDDDQDNRLVLRAICRKLEGFEIQEAVDGIDAVELVRSWHPHIILMDIMMPNMDGFEASKIIKKEFPQIVIIVVTAVMDSRIQDNMSALGNDIYIHKPIDRDLIRYKLDSIGASLRIREGHFSTLSTKVAVNLFNADIRSFKTFFEITNSEVMMDFGMWLFDQYNGRTENGSVKYDKVIEIFYMLMRNGYKNAHAMNIIIEESYDELYITLKFEQESLIDKQMLDILNDSGVKSIFDGNTVCVALSKLVQRPCGKVSVVELEEKKESSSALDENIMKEQVNTKDTKTIDSTEKELLKQSFVKKTSALEYVNEIGGDVLDEIRDIAGLDEEWLVSLRTIEEKPSVEELVNFSDNVLNAYVRVINNLFEFTALAYALSSLSVFIKDSAENIIQDQQKISMLIMLLEHLGSDLSNWRDHIFILQDTADIHYLDSSFFSSCIQIEGIINDKHIDAHDDDNDMEFF